MDSLKSSDPEKIGPFEIVARLGTGGMGVVYLAQQDSERVALKLVAAKLSGDASARTRFLREAQTLRLIKNPFVAQIVDSSDDADFPWIAVEFVSGPSMKELVEDRGPLDTEAWWATALALASALKDTHSHEVTHRDIKPANVLSSETGPKLIDFGIALGVDDTSVTATGVLTGSPAWLSPEQFDGYEVGSASDMFSLGSLLVFLGTGISPWGDSANATSSMLMKSIISKEPQVGNLEAGQQNIVRGLLSKSPGDRPSAVELIDAITSASPEASLERYKAWVAMRGSTSRRGRRPKELLAREGFALESKVPNSKNVSSTVVSPTWAWSRRPKVFLALASIVALGFGAAMVGSIAASIPEECDYPYQPGSASALVAVTNSDEGVPQASFPTPLEGTGRELSVVQEGAGEPVRKDGFVDFDVKVFLGTTGEYLTGSVYEAGNPVRRVIDDSSEDFFSAVLECQKPGSQVVVTTTVEDVFGPFEGDEFLANESSIVVVVNVHQTYRNKANGSPRFPQSGMPTVVQTDEGVHSLSFPNAPIPTELRVSVLKQGDGVAIQEGDFVTTHFTGAVWETQEIFNTSFQRGIPLTLVARALTAGDSFAAGAGDGVIPGLAQALIGQAVGSQVLVSVPPSLGYPAGQAPAGVPDGATLVYVFDILGIG